MTKAKGETARRQMDRIAKLERRMRQLVKKPYKSSSNIAEISALEWAIPILEKHITDTFGFTLPQRLAWHKHEKNNILSILWDRDGEICYLCNNPMRYPHVTIDHVIPLHRGGKDNLSNYRLVHSLCNVQKGNMTVEDYRKAKEQAGA